MKLAPGAAVAGVAMAAAVLAAQAVEPVFDVASIRENTSGAAGTSMNVLPGSRLVATNMPLETLLAAAYGASATSPLPPSRVVMPRGWSGSGAPRFDLDARPPRPLSQAEFLPAVRRLLEDRFKLVLRFETRELPSYVLVVDRPDGRLGPRLKRSDIDCTNATEAAAKEPDGTLRCGIRGRAGRATGRQTMAVLARFLTNLVPDQRAIADRTNLAGTYDFEFDWAPEQAASAGAPPDPDAVSVFTGVREQLGLRLEPSRQQAEVLIVDRAERPTEP